MARIKYVGSSGVRLVDKYRWDQQNHFECEVPAWLVPILLAQPGAEFQEVDPHKLLFEGQIPNPPTGGVGKTMGTQIKPNVRRQEPPQTEEAQ